MSKLPVFPVLGTIGHVSLDGTATDVALSDEYLDQHLDAILHGAGSALKYYTLQKNIDDMRAALKAAIEGAGVKQSLTAQTLPDGWQLVPIEPTEHMTRAGGRAAHRGFHLNSPNAVAADSYKAMLAAAPKPNHAGEATEVMQNAKDAERYRWLRDKANGKWAICEWLDGDEEGPAGYYRPYQLGAELDKTIDAAMKGEK